MVYELAATFDKSNGKFSAIYGNVVIVDCNYFFDRLLQTLKEKVPEQYYDIIENIRVELDDSGLVACDFPYELDGVLKN